jgi:hypothetical protein
VDLGLDGETATRLLGRTSVIHHLEPPPLSERSHRPLHAAREVAWFAAGCTPPARVVALSRIRTGGDHAYRPGSAVAALLGRGSPSRGPIARVLEGRGEPLEPVILRTGVEVDPEGSWTPTPEGKLLHLLVLMHLSVDLRRLRSVASRRLALTSAPLAARAAVSLGSGAPPGPRVADLSDPRPPTLAEVDRALTQMLDGVPEVDGELLSTCRRHADEIAARWTDGEDPVDVLASFTVTEARGGGERLAHDLALAWLPTLVVLESCLGSVVRDMRADIRPELEAETRDALLR